MSREMNEGARVWLVPDGFIPEESSGSLQSHEAICVLNASEGEARLSIARRMYAWRFGEILPHQRADFLRL